MTATSALLMTKKLFVHDAVAGISVSVAEAVKQAGAEVADYEPNERQ